MSTFTRQEFWGTHPELSGDTIWGGQNIGKGMGLTAGFGLHWMPVRGGHMVPGPGIVATHFIDNAFEMCRVEFETDIQGVLRNMALIAENYTAESYKIKHVNKIEAANQKWGKSANLGFEYNEYKPTDFYKGMKVGRLSGPEVYDLKRILPKYTKQTNVSDALLKKIGTMERGGKPLALKGGYKLFRETKVGAGMIDFRLEKDGKVIGWWESGVSDFDQAMKLDDQQYSIKSGLGETIWPGAELRFKGGGMLMFIAEESISTQLTKAANEGYAMLTAALDRFAVNFKVNIAQTWTEARAEYAARRGYPERAFRGKGEPFDPISDISVNVHYPPPPNTGQYADTNMFSVNVFAAHPAATALNYGLRSAREFVGSYETISIRSWKRRGLDTDSWRKAHFESRKSQKS